MYRFVTALSVLLVALPALGGTFDSGSDGSDGPLNCLTLGLGADCASTCTEETPCAVEIDLRKAVTVVLPDNWETTPGGDVDEDGVADGVYDPQQWAVVFKYTTIDIPPFVTVTFHNHPKGAPVVWLASENVIIAGQVRLNGANGANDPDSTYAVPGPGGFSGGILSFSAGSSAGFGPGGGGVASTAGGGGYGFPGFGSNPGGTYGTASIVPLIGGSGGGARTGGPEASGGAGGGAILIASSGNIFLDSTLDPDAGIFAKGSDGGGSIHGGGGSGGGIRLVANDISGSGVLRALGGGTTGISRGGKGRIRVEATTYDLDDLGDPQFPIITVPGLVFPDTETPSLRATIVNNTSVPADPEATVRSGDVVFTAEAPVTIEIEAQNVPLGSIVQVRIVRAFGISQVLFSTPLEGSFDLSTATVENVTFVNGASEVQLSVVVE